MKYYVEVDGQEFEFHFVRRGDQLIAIDREGRERRVDRSLIGDGTACSLVVDGRSHDVLIERDSRGTTVQVGAERLRVVVQDERERAAKAVAGAKGGGLREVRASMPGVVVEVLVQVGDRVTEGQTLVVLEAMKMQNPLHSDCDGVVTAVEVEPGHTVAGGDLLAVVDGSQDDAE